MMQERHRQVRTAKEPSQRTTAITSEDGSHRMELRDSHLALKAPHIIVAAN